VANKSIREVAAILSLARLVISNDTGIMHVAAAVGTPVLSLFGPTDPEQWAPIGTKHRYIVGKGGDIETIPVEEVLTVAREMLGKIHEGVI
jgi:ADP-heptose:LPS heptosyltransferase